MKFIVLFALCAVASSAGAQTLSQLTKEIDRVLPAISTEVTSVLGGEYNDIAKGTSPLLKDLKKLIKNYTDVNVPGEVKSAAAKVLQGLKELDVALDSTTFPIVHDKIQSVLESNKILKK